MQGSRSFSGVTFAVACWLTGVALAKILSPPLALMMALAASLFAAALMWSRWRTPLVLLLFVALGALRYNAPPSQRSIQHLLEATPSMQQPIVGVIVDGPDKREHTWRYTLQLERIAGERIHGRVLFYAPRDDMRPGDRVENLAQVRRVWRRSNFDAYDFAASLAAQGVHGVAFARGVVTVTRGGASLRSWIARLRGWIDRRITARCADHAPLIRSILLGETADDATRETMRRAGLAHLLAVSGLHVGVIWLAAWLLLRAVIPWRNSARVGILLILFVYAALCAWRPSVTRAVVMLAIVTAGGMLQRRPPLLHSLMLAAFIVTFIQPRQLFTPGYQLSYLAVLTLALAVPPLARRFRFADKDSPWYRKLAQWAALLAVSSVAISLSLAPVTLYHFQSLSLNGIVANIVALPLFAVLAPTAMLTVLAPSVGWLVVPLQNALLLMADILVHWGEITARLPLAWDGLGLPAWRAWLLTLAITAAVFALRSRTAVYRRWSLIAASVAALLVIAPLPRASVLRITFVDVGLADMTLLELPSGEAVAIDTGPNVETTGHVTASAAPYMARRGIRKLDAVFVTHAHDDHYGGLQSLCAAFDVERIVVGDETAARLPWLDSLATAEGCLLLTLRDTTSFAWGDVRLRVLHPDASFAAECVNDESLVMRLNYRDFSALFTGDMEAPSEAYLLEHNLALLDCDVLKVAHHGSVSSSTPGIIHAVSPEYAFVPASLRNRHNLPDQEVLDRFVFLEEKLYLAGRDGALRIETDGRSARLESMLREDIVTDADLR